ncbi:MAG: hypothetical protein BWY74_00338 [Firmicutes bacterium ADurb.Bin419]|nr:MAG: hypothetical protein BWY74_00338 [Firmicutes bacterium ADurb.Bin419]
MYLVVVSGFNELIVGEEQKAKIAKIIESDKNVNVIIGKSIIKSKEIKGLIYLPDIQKAKDIKSGKTHPMYPRYIREVNQWGYKKSFETYLTEINYKPKDVVCQN